MKTTKQSTAKAAINSIDSIAAQAGALTVTVQTVQTRKAASAKTIKELAPLAAAMKVAGEETSPELLARLPPDTVAFQCFAQNANSTAKLFAWFDENQACLTRTTKEGKTLLDMAGAYCSAFNIVHNKTNDGPLKGYPFYKRFSNALQQWAKRNKNIEKRASGAITDAIASYLNKKEKEDSEALEDSIVAWVLKSPPILNRIIYSKAV